jgi:hypothetical protein
VLALLADGPLAGRELELDEPRPTIAMTDDGLTAAPGHPAPHRYRLAGVELERLDSAPERTRRVAVYVCAREHRARKTMRRAA